MHVRTLVLTLVLGLLTALPAWAGPPLICHPIDIGSAPSLPWQNTMGWNGAVNSYDTSRLIPDTLSLLTPQMPTAVREETMRRAAIYASRQNGLADRLLARLLARTTDPQTRAEATSWFDAGYFAETVREAALAYDMLHDPAQRAAWTLRAPVSRVDAAAFIHRAIRLGGKNMEAAATIVEAAQRAE